MTYKTATILLTLSIALMGCGKEDNQVNSDVVNSVIASMNDQPVRWNAPINFQSSSGELQCAENVLSDIFACGLGGSRATISIAGELVEVSFVDKDKYLSSLKYVIEESQYRAALRAASHLSKQSRGLGDFGGSGANEESW